MTKKGNIPYIPIGRLKLFRKETLDLWLTAKEDISIKPIIPYKHTRLNRIPIILQPKYRSICDL